MRCWASWGSWGSAVLGAACLAAACTTAPSAPEVARAPAAAPAPAPRPVPSAEPAPVAHRFAVAAEQQDAARVAMEVLERGGSAADAAVAATLIAGVAQPVSSGLGGGGFALYWDAQARRATFLDFRECAPIGIKPDDYLRRPVPQARRGVLVGVPGELAGLEALHQRWGRLPFGETVRPAIELARQGFAASPHLARSLAWSRRWIEADSAARVLFAPEGTLAAPGARLNNPELGGALERIAAQGASALYRGELGDDVIATAARARGRMAKSDLERYRVVEREPLAIDYAGRRILTAPPPSAGGLLLAQTLAMHPPEALARLERRRGAYLHLLAETFRGAQLDRLRYIGDPAFIKMDVAALGAPARMQARRRAISLERTAPPAPLELEEGGTSQLVVVDGDDNVALVVSSLGDMFGARLVTGAGFVLNSQLASFTHPRQSRRLKSRVKPNEPRGGARPTASLTPTLVLEGDRPVLALGASGGTRIPTAVAQVLLAQLVFGRSPADSVREPRIQTPFGGGLRVEPRAGEELVADLRARGEVVASRPDYSAVQLVALSTSQGVRRLTAVSDPRKGGHALVR